MLKTRHSKWAVWFAELKTDNPQRDGGRNQIYHGDTEKSKTLPLMTLMKLMDADSESHHRSTQINTDHVG